jgi:hypothetical protein
MKSYYNICICILKEGVFVITKEEWKNIRGSSPAPDQIMLSIKGDAAHSMTVRWRTDITVTEGYALYREVGTTDWQKADAEFITFNTDMDDSNFFFADMKALKADTEYEYTCGNDDVRSPSFTFRTAEENCEKFSFLCISDIQAGDA